VPINVILRAADYHIILEDSDCSAVIFSPEFSGELLPALAAHGGPPIALPVEGDPRLLAGAARRGVHHRNSSRCRGRDLSVLLALHLRARPAGPRAVSTDTATWS